MGDAGVARGMPPDTPEDGFDTGAAPLSDVAVRDVIRSLGIPGIADVHVHLLPADLQLRVWRHFDSAGPMIGRPWPITYRWQVPRLVDHLLTLGVRAFSTMPYAHRPGLARALTEHSLELGRRFPAVLPTLTFFPEPSAAAYVADALAAGARIGKVHLQVGDFDPREPQLRDVWGMLADAALPIVMHAGSGPVPGRHTGVEPVTGLLAEHPRLVLIVAHMGAPECEEFLRLVETHESVYLDTTMAFTDFVASMSPYPDALLPRLADVHERVLFGSDFPSIPYPYAHAVEAIQRLGMGAAWERGVLWRNAARLLDLPAEGP